jgi:hypothetical protein
MTTMWRPHPLTVSGAALAAIVLGAARAAAQGCAMCGSAVRPDDPLASALNSSILFLMAAPYALIGGAAVWLVVQYRRRRSTADQADVKEE